MKFNPEATLSKRFTEGVYFVSIDDIQRKPTSTGIEKWDITVKDEKGNIGRVAFFDNGDDINPERGMSDNDWFLQKMLKSIQDAGFTIPDADYNFDNIDRFLASKKFKAYVRFVPQKNNPEYTNGYFANKFAYDKAHEGEEKQSSETKNDNPFAASGNTAIDIKDEDIPF